jgi:glycerophosphoryl diester phosphodiesterase
MFATVILSSITNGTWGQEFQRAIKLPMISAHRGASRLAPENTLVAFSKAMELGSDFIELDVRTTADGAQVILHDQSLKRTAALDARIAKTNLTNVKKLSAGNWFGEQYKDERVPTLEEVCELVVNENRRRGSTANLYVDCKSIDAGEVIRILNQHRLLDSAVFYGRINTLKEIKKFYKLARVMPSYPGEEKMDRLIRKLAPYAVDIPYGGLDEETVAFCHRKGIKVFSDLLGQNDIPASYRKAIRLEIDLIQTDDVSGVIKTFKEFEEPLQK